MESAVEPAASEQPQQGGQNDRPTQHADHREVLAERAFALTRPKLAPLLPCLDGLAEFLVIIGLLRHGSLSGTVATRSPGMAGVRSDFRNR